MQQPSSSHSASSPAPSSPTTTSSPAHMPEYIKPDLNAPSPKTMKHATPDDDKPAKRPKISKVKGESVGPTWTSERKKALVETIIDRGIASTSPTELATMLGLTKQQVANALQKGRNNLRAKLIAAAEEL